MRYEIVNPQHATVFADCAGLESHAGAEVLLLLNGASFVADDSRVAILVELDDQCLGEITGEQLGEEGGNVLGFSRYRNGRDAPSRLVEIVRQKRTTPGALTAARRWFEQAGLEPVVCDDQAGRIIDRLVRPKYNAALRFLDEGLASQADMDLTCRLGLGYPDGPIERVVRGGLDRHHELCWSLFELSGQVAYVPARRAAVAARRMADGQEPA